MFRFLLILSALLICLVHGAVSKPLLAQESPGPAAKRILVLVENESTLFAAMETTRGLRSKLYDRPPTRIELYTEYLDILRFPDPEHRERMHRSIAGKYEEVPIDLVVALGGHALDFLLDYRTEFAPGVPLVFGGLSRRNLPHIAMDEGMWGMLNDFDMIRTLELAAALHPEARRVAVLTGSSPFDQRWRSRAESDLGAHHKNLEVVYLSGLSLEGFKEEARKLTPDTILLLLTVFEDADQRSYIPAEAAAEIAAVSGAPSYAVYDTYIGKGVVGGFVDSFHGIGEEVGDLVHDVLAGKPPVSRVNYTTGNFVVDWREARRWGIKLGNLPPGTVLENYDPSLWERHRLEVLLAVGVVLLQTATIIGLILTDRRRRQIRDELALQRLELSHLARSTQLGELSGAFAHELNQPLTAILANAEAGARMLESDSVDLQEIGEILRDIVADDKRAAAYITQLRRLMLKEEGTFERLDLNKVTRATVDLVRGELLARNTAVEFRPHPGELMVEGNLVQLQQVVINLLLNAADAMSSLPPERRSVSVETRAVGEERAELSVSDCGLGVAPEVRDRMFKPFVTTKRDGLGLGLAICRSIAEAHGGSLEVDERQADGARMVLVLPAQ